MRSRPKNIALILLTALYLIAANGRVLEHFSRWYSVGGEVAIPFHFGPSKDVPGPSATQRTYEPQTSIIFLLSTALFAHTIVHYPRRLVTYTWANDTLPCYSSDFSSSLSNRAPPEA